MNCSNCGNAERVDARSVEKSSVRSEIPSRVPKTNGRFLMNLHQALTDFPWVFPYTLHKIATNTPFRALNGKYHRLILPPDKIVRGFIRGDAPLRYFVSSTVKKISTQRLIATEEFFSPEAIDVYHLFADEWMVDGDFRFKRFFQTYFLQDVRRGQIHERRQQYLLNAQIQHYRAIERVPEVPLLLPDNTVVWVQEVIDLPENTQKADMMGVDAEGNPTLFISYKEKSRGTPQQWGGISKRNEYSQWVHPETQSFIADVAKSRHKYPEGFFARRKIKDRDIKMRAVYGSDYGSPSFGPNNVHFVAVGDIQLGRSGSYLALSARERLLFSGDAPPKTFSPVFAARFDGNRSDCGIPFTRLGIFPQERRGNIIDV
jgi:hypothetical protein